MAAVKPGEPRPGNQDFCAAPGRLIAVDHCRFPLAASLLLPRIELAIGKTAPRKFDKVEL